MIQTIKQPVSMRIYEYEDTYRMELFKYHVKKKQPMHLLEKVMCVGQRKRNQQLEEWQKQYHIHDQQQFHGVEETDYPSHRRLTAYTWKPKELQMLFHAYFDREYGLRDVWLDVAFDVYDGNFSVYLASDEKMGEHDKLVEALYENFGVLEGRRFQFEDYWQDVLSDIIGKKYAYAYTEDTSMYNKVEKVWRDDSIDVPVWFYFYEE